MTLDQIAKIIQVEARKIGSIKPLTSGQLDLLFKKANLDLFNNKYGFLKSGLNPEQNQKISDDLRVFKKTTTLTLTTGYSALPVDYAHYIYSTVNGVEVDLLTDSELNPILNDAILSPTTSYPVANIRGGGIYVYPNTITSLSLVYYKYPTAPNYGRTAINGVFIYSTVMSEELEWQETCHIDIIRYMLGYLGISINEGQLLQYTEAKKLEEG